jgi:hypothetical protein
MEKPNQVVTTTLSSRSRCGSHCPVVITDVDLQMCARPQQRTASMRGSTVSPWVESSYSTRGGTSGHCVRITGPCCSRFRSVSARTLCDISGFNRWSSLNRCVPDSSQYRPVMFPLTPMAFQAAVSGQPVDRVVSGASVVDDAERVIMARCGYSPCTELPQTGPTSCPWQVPSAVALNVRMRTVGESATRPQGILARGRSAGIFPARQCTFRHLAATAVCPEVEESDTWPRQTALMMPGSRVRAPPQSAA